MPLCGAMDPTMEELEVMGTDSLPLKALQNYIGIKDEFKEAFFEELGGIDKVRELVYIPIEDWNKAVGATEIKTDAVEESEGFDAVPARARHPTPKEKGQVGMLRRFARLPVGLPGDEGGPLRGQAAAGQRGGGGAGQQAGDTEVGQGRKGGSSERRRFKISSVLDQRDDQEVEALAPLHFREAILRYKLANDGLEPSKEEESTADQLQAVKVKLDHDVVPYADFGVLRPFGIRLKRVMKFHAKFWDPSTAEFVAKELPGPTSFEEWQRSWRVYSFILVALGAVSKARLERYQAKVGELVAKYGNLRGGSWWIVALADHKMRAEEMKRIRRKLDSAHTEGRFADAGGLDPAKPWDAVFLAAALDNHYWSSEVAEVAMLFVARVKDQAELADPGHHVIIEGAARGLGGGGGTRGHDDRDRGHAHRRELEKAKKKRKHDAQLAEREGNKYREHEPHGVGGQGRQQGQGSQGGQGEETDLLRLQQGRGGVRRAVPQRSQALLRDMRRPASC